MALIGARWCFYVQVERVFPTTYMNYTAPSRINATSTSLNVIEGTFPGPQGTEGGEVRLERLQGLFANLTGGLRLELPLLVTLAPSRSTNRRYTESR